MKEQTPIQSLCPCDSGKEYSACCLPILTDHKLALTAETLMRSRYTAFSQEDTDHILRTWIQNKRPSALNFADNPVTWIGLVINNTVEGKETDTKGQVDFTSTYIEDGQLCALGEISNFSKIDGLWYYVNGVCEVTKSKIERNRPCPCGSGKKFKRCCLMK
ncbi:MAG: SEC-C motif-containing protein [Desulforhopalus sp.]|jgi:SEC-C motif-containing protein